MMNKQEFKEKANQAIDQISDGFSELKNQKENVQADLRSKYDEALTDIESKKSDLQSKYAELEGASEEKWDEMRDAFSAAVASMNESVSKLGSLIS